MNKYEVEISHTGTDREKLTVDAEDPDDAWAKVHAQHPKAWIIGVQALAPFGDFIGA